MAKSEPGNNLHSPTSRATHTGGISACSGPQSAPVAVFLPPPDLQAFVQVRSVTEVATLLGMSRKSAWRLRGGHWPRDSRSLMLAWQAYKGRSSKQQSEWFLRRVYPGGVIRHAGRDWSAPGMAARTGQSLAVARAEGGALLAQTLDMPSQRLELLPTLTA